MGGESGGGVMDENPWRRDRGGEVIVNINKKREKEQPGAARMPHR